MAADVAQRDEWGSKGAFPLDGAGEQAQRLSVWPTLPELAAWQDTRDTVHLWTQVVGKIRLALAPMLNHWWQVPLYVSSRGLTTSLMHSAGRGVEIEFDFVDHALVARTSDGGRRRVELVPRSVADFYAATMSAMGDLGVRVDVLARPVEIPGPTIPFDQDAEHRSYDPDAIHRFWLALVQAHRVLSRFRARFVGKASPVHFFWGAFDLATSRFSGRRAPTHPGGVPNCPDWVQQEAYSHEVSSCGFWPGFGEGAFYAYAYPTPAGFADWDVGPGASYDHDLGEFLLPYTAVRTGGNPDAVLLEFLQRTYEAAAKLGGWDRVALETRQ